MSNKLFMNESALKSGPLSQSCGLGTTHEFDRLLHWVRLAAARINNNLPAIEKHLASLRERGETEKRINALDHWPQSLVFTEREKAALKLCEAIASHDRVSVPRAVLEEARRYFCNDELIRLMITTMADNQPIDFCD